MDINDMKYWAENSSSVEIFIDNIGATKKKENAVLEKRREEEQKRQGFLKEFQQLPIHEQNEIAKANPELFDKILSDPSTADGNMPTSREEFQQLPIYKQNELYTRYPEKINMLMGW